MSCFPCFTSKVKKTNSKDANSRSSSESPPHEARNKNETPKADGGPHIDAKTFTFRELASATKNFRQECLLGEGAFGRVYKGRLENSGQDVAVKQLDRNGLHGNKEFLQEVSMLSLLDHENLVNLVGYCADGEQRLLVCEYMSLGSLADHLFEMKPDQEPLSWPTRMNVALGAARGVEYLHEKANPPVLYRDLKSSNILLCGDFHPKLSTFGLGKANSVGDKMQGSRVMGTYGYCAPEYSRDSQFTLKSDIYSFGVVLLELITGRKAIDTTRPMDEQNLVSWAQPKFRDPKKFPEMADPLLKRRFPEKSLNQAVAIAAMCLQEEASVRPLISDVVITLSFLVVSKEENMCDTTPLPSLPPADSGHEKGGCNSEHTSDHEDEGSNSSKSGSQEGSEEESEEEHQHDHNRPSRDGSEQGDHDSGDECHSAVTGADEWGSNSSHYSNS
ncbi:hypothetical protein PVL29_004805 [Vitis rotundifolia]|uniref:Protein kinase domain-containing protein n=1 Tax=Vitis rotundifolia TaxID=103349 RepID=A0AA39A9X0_VITRO|nr:hypothetical protein PVL29_004805 [Vitis rotundifolia]